MNGLMDLWLILTFIQSGLFIKKTKLISSLHSNIFIQFYLITSRWITTHGFSLNVNPDMSFFDTSFIIPCGIEERGVTSIFKIFQEQGKLASSVPSLQQISEVVLMCFNDTFGVFTKSGRKLSWYYAVTFRSCLEQICILLFAMNKAVILNTLLQYRSYFNFSKTMSMRNQGIICVFPCLKFVFSV